MGAFNTLRAVVALATFASYTSGLAVNGTWANGTSTNPSSNTTQPPTVANSTVVQPLLADGYRK